MVKAWRVYNDGSLKNETEVVRINGVDLWSEYNQKWRFGCAQIMQEDGKDPVILYDGYLNAERLQPFLEKIKRGEIK